MAIDDTSSSLLNNRIHPEIDLARDPGAISPANGEDSSSAPKLVSETRPSTPGSSTSAATITASEKGEYKGDDKFSNPWSPSLEDEFNQLALMVESCRQDSAVTTPVEATSEPQRNDSTSIEEKPAENLIDDSAPTKKETYEDEVLESRPGLTKVADSTEIETPKSRPTSPESVDTDVSEVTRSPESVINPFGRKNSDAAKEWQLRKQNYGEESDALDELMTYQGIEDVKQQFLDIYSRCEIRKKQFPSWKKGERLNMIFQGNPGTGKTTIARLYAKFLHEVGLIDSNDCVELSGIQAAANGVVGIKKKLKSIISNGGVLFIDEAYQLVAGYLDGMGRQVLDLILTEMENNKGKFAVILVGYKEQLEPLFHHNVGLLSRFPYIMNFTDFDNGDLWQILVNGMRKLYEGKMQIDGGEDGLYTRIIIRRLAQARGSRSFGNARAVENTINNIADRQARRLIQEKKRGDSELNYYLFTKEDLIGPDPSIASKSSLAYMELQELIGLEKVKESVDQLIRLISVNYKRELKEKSPLKFSLSQVFIGAPGTGKTTVAGLYGRILADLGYLSQGDVVFKTAADFIGESLGKSEANTKRILDTTLGKILVIDEAYMLDVGESGKDQDKFKTGILDTMVSIIQGTPGEDRCVILVGYEDKMKDMFRNANPGLSRRFPINAPFRFENFSADQLEQILRLKIKQSDLEITDEAIGTAREMFTTALMRPNFTNAGEVDGILATAKKNYEKRLYKSPVEEDASSLVLNAVDFDLKFDRGDKPELDIRMLTGQVDDTIIDQLSQYFNAYHNAKKCGLNPRDVVATNFVFKGGPGSGKTTTAKQMGKIFYNMGYLSSSEVVECSAADLIGQYVGHTAPKAKKKLQEGLGHVLLIDEAHRLMYSGFAIEAIDELVNFVSKNAGKVVVIMAGFTADVSQLLSIYSDLSGHFSEVITFPNIQPGDCIRLLVSELAKFNIRSANNFLNNPHSDQYKKIRRLFRALSVMPFWNNARDVKSLAKQLLRRYLGRARSHVPRQGLAFDFVALCLQEQILQRKQRVKMPKANEQSSIAKKPSPQQYQQMAPPPPSAQICVQKDQGFPHIGTLDTEKQESVFQLENSQSNIPIAILVTEPLQLVGHSQDEHEIVEEEAETTEVHRLHKTPVSDERRQELQEAKNLSVAKEKLADGNLGDDDQSSWKAKYDNLENQIAAIYKEIQREEEILKAIRTVELCCAGMGSRNGRKWSLSNHLAPSSTGLLLMSLVSLIVASLKFFSSFIFTTTNTMSGFQDQEKRLMMDPIEFWSSQGAHPKPSSSAPPTFSRRSGSRDRDDPLLSTPPTQFKAPEKQESRQSRMAVVLKSPPYLQQGSRSQADVEDEDESGAGPSQKTTSSLASRAKKETPVPLPRQIARASAPAVATVATPISTPVPLPKQLGRPPTLTTATKPEPTPVPLPKPVGRPPKSASATTAVPAVPAAPQPSAGRGRPKGWRPGMSYSSLRGPDSKTSVAGRAVRQAKPKPLPLGYAKRRGRPPKAPSPLPWQVYQSINTSFAAFLCEWSDCKAELHNLDTLRRHVSVVHCRKGPFVCRWGKCAQNASFHVFPNTPSLSAHVEKAHLIPFSWHVGDGPQNKGGPKHPLEDEEIPGYLKDDKGNQVTPSIRDQEVEDFVTWKNNRQKLKDLLIRMNENLPSEESDTPNDED
ncbi:stage v sporulation k [Trichoderma arundinaceum]|uniref:Stage v sporulation k n=1 Tax=Trichoderma arundinaceum TaxID=490622 RepID=A0A395NEA4_TRIAR|nr:stage v sporulation k [Trichoderma arundinaceum]